MRITQVLAFLGAAAVSGAVLAAPAPVAISNDGNTVYVMGTPNPLIRLTPGEAENAQGSFRLEDGRVLRLFSQGNKMFMDLDGRRQELLPTSRTSFVARRTGAEVAVDDLLFPDKVRLTERR